MRSGARIQLSDLGEEKLIEFTGERSSVEEAIALMVDEFTLAASGDTATSRKEGSTKSGRELAIAALVPLTLSSWLEGEDGRPPPLEIPGPESKPHFHSLGPDRPC